MRSCFSQQANGECGVRRRAPARQEQDDGDEHESHRGSDAGVAQGVDGKETDAGGAVLLVWMRGPPVPERHRHARRGQTRRGDDREPPAKPSIDVTPNQAMSFQVCGSELSIRR